MKLDLRRKISFVSKKYKNSPLIEALCEFQFEPTTSWDIAIPGLIYEEVKDAFPKRFQFQLQSSQLNLNIGRDVAEITGQIVPLIRFQRPDDLALIQVGPNLLTINHLKPYPSWQDFLPLIERGFNAYQKVVNPTGIQRISLRYINRIEVPDPSLSLEHYFEFRPFLGTKKLQHANAFTMGIQIPYEDGKDVLNLLLSSIPGDDSNTTAILLDLNYLLPRQENSVWNDVAQWIEVAHKRIEEIFEASITEALRHTFEEIK